MYLKASNTGADDVFGTSMDLISFNSLARLVVGAPGEDSATVGNPSDDSLASSGAAYCFDRQLGAWSQSHFLKAQLDNLDSRRPRHGHRSRVVGRTDCCEAPARVEVGE